MASIRNVNPEVTRAKCALAGLISKGAPQSKIDQARRGLEQAKFVAAVEAICDSPVALTPEQFVHIVKALTNAMGKGAGTNAQ